MPCFAEPIRVHLASTAESGIVGSAANARVLEKPLAYTTESGDTQFAANVPVVSNEAERVMEDQDGEVEDVEEEEEDDSEDDEDDDKEGTCACRQWCAKWSPFGRKCY
jgi:hypothetical protein